jgi:hypothetical protein
MAECTQGLLGLHDRLPQRTWGGNAGPRAEHEDKSGSFSVRYEIKEAPTARWAKPTSEEFKLLRQNREAGTARTAEEGSG